MNELLNGIVHNALPVMLAIFFLGVSFANAARKRRAAASARDEAAPQTAAPVATAPSAKRGPAPVRRQMPDVPAHRPPRPPVAAYTDDLPGIDLTDHVSGLVRPPRPRLTIGGGPRWAANAVVAAEIFGPPIALRQPGDTLLPPRAL